MGLCLSDFEDAGTVSMTSRVLSIAERIASFLRRSRMSSVISVSSGRESDTSVVMLLRERPESPTNTPLIRRGATPVRRSMRSIILATLTEVSSRFWITPYLTASTSFSCSRATTSSCPSSLVRPTAAIILQLLISMAAIYLASLISVV